MLEFCYTQSIVDMSLYINEDLLFQWGAFKLYIADTLDTSCGTIFVPKAGIKRIYIAKRDRSSCPHASHKRRTWIVKSIGAVAQELARARRKIDKVVALREKMAILRLLRNFNFVLRRYRSYG